MVQNDDGGDHHHGSWDFWRTRIGVPYFSNHTQTRVVTSIGQTTYLHCLVGNLGDRQVRERWILHQGAPVSLILSPSLSEGKVVWSRSSSSLSVPFPLFLGWLGPFSITSHDTFPLLGRERERRRERGADATLDDNNGEEERRAGGREANKDKLKRQQNQKEIGKISSLGHIGSTPLAAEEMRHGGRALLPLHWVSLLLLLSLSLSLSLSSLPLLPFSLSRKVVVPRVERDFLLLLAPSLSPQTSTPALSSVQWLSLSLRAESNIEGR